jgi:prepilin-type N-terminal cleavage/methylation domain-containing protein
LLDYENYIPTWRIMMANQKGFTLIELLVVVAIIGILAAIVVTQTAVHRAAAHCAKVEADVKNATSNLEAAFAKNETYDNVTLTTSPGVTLSTTAATADIGTITASHPACQQGIYRYSSSTGKFEWTSAS